MRQLRLTRRPTPAAEAAAAHAWQVLQALPVPVDLPDFAAHAFSERGLRYILSIARQYAGSSDFSCAELATAGHAAAVAAAMRYRTEPGLYEQFAAWWIRQGILMKVAGRGLEFSA